ncbi:Nodal modulator 2 isoform 1 [Schistosoma japonicum]|uniref:Nodal modulator 2 isoform 1 n=1 Tax=Schistosoma japonicum TaxID=6182 RepID=A0A4Z2DP12_SCHJA|nr:Nodal modulator 2 isoform 1 [Schistosoma japonicum]
MIILLISLLLFPTRISSQLSGTVVGCGGFIKWKDSRLNSVLDFQKLKISLFSETTSTLKDVTDVLPNGAYSVPLYDEGVYRIRLTTPKGWHIEPSDGYILDLLSDSNACSRDFDFNIVGFSVFGQVTTSGMQTGPSGLSVRLTDPTSHKPILHNFTQNQGYFTISPVTPGSYLVTISNQDHSDKDHTRASVSIKVQSDSISLSEPIILLGHFLRGRVVDFSQSPLVNARVFLFCNKTKTVIKSPTLSTSVSKYVVEILGEIHHKFVLTQESLTDTDGYFTFDRLPGGDYLLVPLYMLQNSSVVFSFTPKFLPVIMEHTDVDLGSSTFTLQSFTLNPGRIMWPNSAPIPSAKVTITGASQQSVVTDINGFYQLNNLFPGEYKFQVEVESAYFETSVMSLNYELESLPNLTADKVSVCGSLIPADMSSNLKFKVDVIVRNIANDTQTIRTETNLEGTVFRFCTFLIPGRYSLHPDVSLLGSHQQSDETALRFSPSEIMIDLTGPPVNNVTFSQFRAKLFGRINCLHTCSNYKTPFFAQLTLLHSNTVEPKLYEFIPSKNDSRVAFFKAENMLPGEYVIQVVFYAGTSFSTIDSWCWSHPNKLDDRKFQVLESSKRILRIHSSDLHYDKESALDFHQTGFLIPVHIELPNYVTRIPDVLLYASNSVQENNKTTENFLMWNLTKTCNKICLPSPEKVYKISSFSTCAQIKLLQTTEINPSSDCHISLNSTVLIRIGVEKLPVFIHVKLDKVAERFMGDLKELFSSPYLFQVEDSIPNTSVAHSNLVETIWYKKPDSFEPPSTIGIFWVNIKNTVRVTPKLSNLKSNHMVHLITHPSSLEINLQSGASQQQQLIENSTCSLATPKFQAPISPSVNNVQSLCASLFVGQNIEFTLTVAVNLRGRIDPPTEKVDIQLYNKLPQLSEEASTYIQHDLPLLPANSVSDLVVESEEDNSSEPIAVTQSDNQGLFFFNALHLKDYEAFSIKSLSDVSKMYRITLSKTGYKFDLTNETYVEQNSGSFNWYVKSIRLSLVEVFVYKHPVSEDSRHPLSAVLISIIGEGHRANHLTNDDGVVRFVGLSPGQYYIRPMMKEYSFTVISPSQSESGQAVPVQVEEGKSAVVILSSLRIAFSATGTVTSLAGVPESGVLVEATWLPEPQHSLHNDLLGLKSNNNMTCRLRLDQVNIIPREQSVTDSNGTFRIRGLMPGCIYAISVHTNPFLPNLLYDQLTRISSRSSPVDVEYAIPDHLNLQMLSSDINGIHFYIIRHLCTSMITVSVQTPDNYLPTLQLVVFPVGHPENIIAKHDFGIDSSLFSLSGSKLIPMIGYVNL